MFGVLHRLSCLRYVWISSFIALLPLAASADYYKYTDRKGTVCITNRLDSVPPVYRSTMKVIKEEKKPSAVQPPAPSASGPAAVSENMEETFTAAPANPTKYPWMKPVALAAGAIVGFLLVRRLSGALSSPQLARLITITFFVGVFTLGYKLYADYLVNGYFTIKSKVLGMFEKSQQRQLPEPGEKSAGSAAPPP